jgi:uncharacterized protein (DUF1810 family)
MQQAPFNLERFLTAQDLVYDRVTAELARGRKTSHWIWFIFPQLYGLGQSARSQKYGIRARAEAAAYLAHPILGARLIECTALVSEHKNSPVGDIFPYPDDKKFHSSMTLFHAVSGRKEFADALAQFFAGVGDEATLALLGN